MRLTPPERDAVCEYVEGRRAAGARYDEIAEELIAYTQGNDPRITNDELDSIEDWHRAWQRRQAYRGLQQRTGDARSGSRIAEVPVEWAAVDAGEVRLATVTQERAELTLDERAEALAIVMYLRKGLLKARWKWVHHRRISLPDGVGYQIAAAPGRMTLPDGTETQWAECAIIIRRGDEVIDVHEDCRRRQEIPAGVEGRKHRSIILQRREIVGESVDLRDIAARLATLLHVCLGGAKSPFRNNEHLAQLLGVTREAMRVRKKRIMADAGMQCAEGMAPGRAKGGRAAQRKREAA